MRVRNVAGNRNDKVEISMTPMIDIVFQLLVFFIMTFRIVAQEGDFNVKMPLSAPAEGLPDPDRLPPMKVRLQAHPSGELALISLNEQPLGQSFRTLHNQIRDVVGDDRGPGSIQETAEVELDADYHLRYEYVISAITAVSGYLDANRNIVNLVERVRFSPPRTPPN